jgi:hypothetical protein
MPSSPQRAGAIVDEVYQRFYAMAEPNYNWEEAKKPGKMRKLNYRYLVEYTTGILAPAYHRIHDLYLRVMTDKKGSRLIIALRRYKNKNGVWPKGLDDIKSLAPAEIFVDPFNSEVFVYEVTEENFTLYSRGKNGIDEKGWYKDGADDWPIWPPPGKKWKTKEKKENAEQH